MSACCGVSVATNGDVYYTEMDHHIVRRLSNGIVTTIAGNRTRGYGGDGGAATQAMLDTPHGIALDIYGNIYIADHHNHAVRKVYAHNGTIVTIAGNGTDGYSGDGGPATR
jgi:hypothetical protein